MQLGDKYGELHVNLCTLAVSVGHGWKEVDLTASSGKDRLAGEPIVAFEQLVIFPRPRMPCSSVECMSEVENVSFLWLCLWLAVV